jgi:hypothetical protein
MTVPFTVEVDPGPSLRLTISGQHPPGSRPISRNYSLKGRGQQDYLDLFAMIGRDFGTRIPRNRRPTAGDARGPAWTTLLTENILPDGHYGYGDPAILRVEEYGTPTYYALVTSNDAPDAFPILKSHDLKDWELRGFAFPRGAQPVWAMHGPGSDFWAPELHHVGDSFWLCFTAREPDGSLAIGIAQASSPEGPFVAGDQPLLRGGMIDAHIFVDREQGPVLLWKEDANGRWPELLAGLLHHQPSIVESIFTEAVDRRTASLVAAFWPLMARVPPMERFFMLQPLIEAAVDDLASLRSALARVERPVAAEIIAATYTPIFAQPLAGDGKCLTGDRSVVLVNDLDWEGHLIEGPWLTRQNGRYSIFYAGNDFCTSEYGIGVATADHLLGPYRKQPKPLLRSSGTWTGPGHPSVAAGPDGVPRLFFHAYPPGQAGYKAFRAMLSVQLCFDGQQVSVIL